MQRRQRMVFPKVRPTLLLNKAICMQAPQISPQKTSSTSCVGLCATNRNSGIASALLRPYSDTLHDTRGRSVCFRRAASPQSTGSWVSKSLAAVAVCWHTAISCIISMLQQCTIVQKTIAQSPSSLQSNKQLATPKQAYIKEKWI